MYMKWYIDIYIYIFKYYYLIGFGLRCNSVYCYIKHFYYIFKFIKYLFNTSIVLFIHLFLSHELGTTEFNILLIRSFKPTLHVTLIVMFICIAIVI